MGDELGDEWWQHEEGTSESSECNKDQKTNTEEKDIRKRKVPASKSVKTKKKKKKQLTESLDEIIGDHDSQKVLEKPKRRRKKKKITDVLAASSPQPGCPADLQKVIEAHYTGKRSVIEMEELSLPDSCFFPSNDLSHSLSSFLKEICPKWVKFCKKHAENKSPLMLIVCSSAYRALELIKLLTTFKGDCKVLKLFAKHIKVEEQIKQLQKGVSHIGVGTPCRMATLLKQDAFNLQALKAVVLDWNWRDKKMRRMVDIPEVRLDMLKLFELGITQSCKTGSTKVALF
ncbi:protein CMSS1 isoform X1 [Erpetoichthys calabaricus]|uniref:protein CMSS1 isoform X1 n=1 Tax=Erpetoichthys calabaricus TaxID=27687 RepID=UPI00109FAD0A|nr:protein CMSS1 isoform X1 [Erpetoichthys calabaricus]